MSYESKGTAFWDMCYNLYDYVILVILVVCTCKLGSTCTA